MSDETRGAVEAARKQIYGVMGWVTEPSQHERMIAHLDSELPKLEAAIRADERERTEEIMRALHAAINVDERARYEALRLAVDKVEHERRCRLRGPEMHGIEARLCDCVRVEIDAALAAPMPSDELKQAEAEARDELSIGQRAAAEDAAWTRVEEDLLTLGNSVPDMVMGSVAAYAATVRATEYARLMARLALFDQRPIAKDRIDNLEAAIRADERARYEALVVVAAALPHDSRCPAAYTPEDRCLCSRSVVRVALAALEGGTES